jgi:hypothetical protein
MPQGALTGAQSVSKKSLLPPFVKGGRGDLGVATWGIPPHPPLTKGGRENAGDFLDTLSVLRSWLHHNHWARGMSTKIGRRSS